MSATDIYSSDDPRKPAAVPVFDCIVYVSPEPSGGVQARVANLSGITVNCGQRASSACENSSRLQAAHCRTDAKPNANPLDRTPISRRTGRTKTPHSRSSLGIAVLATIHQAKSHP